MGDDVEAQQDESEVAKVLLAPSNVAARMRPDLDPADAADQYVTDGHEHVPAEVLQDALVYLEYANASYYIEVPPAWLLGRAPSALDCGSGQD